jgi:hypothetical protein
LDKFARKILIKISFKFIHLFIKNRFLHIWPEGLFFPPAAQPAEAAQPARPFSSSAAQPAEAAQLGQPRMACQPQHLGPSAARQPHAVAPRP